MKRRPFLGSLGALTTVGAIGGCSSLGKSSSYDDYTPPGSISRTTLGKTGIEVSRLGFGSHLKLKTLERPEYRDRMIRRSFDWGVNFFDVYDHKLSDVVLGKRVEVDHKQFKPMGRSLRGIRKDAVVSLVSVKPLDQVQEEIDGALTDFMTDYIDLYRIYAIDDERMAIMEKNKKAGKIRAIGFVEHDVATITKALDRYGDRLDYVMVVFNFHHNKAILFKEHENPSFENDYSALFPRCERMGLGIIGMKPMGSDAMVGLAQKHGMFRRRDPNLAQAMIRYVMQTREIDVTIPAMNTMEELVTNIEAACTPRLSMNEQALLDEMSSIAASSRSAYLPGHYKWLENWATRQA